MGDPDTSHTEHEDHGWTRNIPDHPPRTDSADYVRSRTRMNAMAEGISPFFYGPPDYEDHHGGGLWLKDDDGWFIVRNVAGIEWSAQFCADPAKVDQLRINARRLYAAFPDAVADLGIRELLDTPIVDAAGVAAWTDSICNASVPLPANAHRGVLPTAGGIHHYPAPVAEIAFFKYDDFDLWVDDSEGNQIAVVPLAPGGPATGGSRSCTFAGRTLPNPSPRPIWVRWKPGASSGRRRASRRRRSVSSTARSRSTRSTRRIRSSTRRFRGDAPVSRHG